MHPSDCPPARTRFYRPLTFTLALLLAALGTAAAPGAPLILDTQLPVGVAGAPYAYFALTATGGTSPYSFSIIAGSLPASMTMDSGGLFQGTPDATGTFPLTFQVVDFVGGIATKALTLTVSSPPILPLWTSRGLIGGTLYGTRISPDYANDQTLFATGASNEINRSSNQAVSWTPTIVNPYNPGQAVDAIELSPVFSMNSSASEAVQTLFVATGGGM